MVKVFQRALEQNEPKKVFKQLVNIYVASNKFEVSRLITQYTHPDLMQVVDFYWLDASCSQA